MITDPVPRGGERRAEHERSDALATLPVPGDARLAMLARAIEDGMTLGTAAPVQRAALAFVTAAAEFYGVPVPGVRVLKSRPLRVYESGTSELFGDYDLETGMIRVWMRTAVQHRVTSFGTLLSTLCHEFCHHLDLKLLGFPATPHTRGFYARTAVLYHHARGTPPKPLVWRRLANGRWQIDWTRMKK